jgi:ankyrin repeat protein
MQTIWEDARTGKLTEKRLLDHMMEDPESLDAPDLTGATPLGHAFKACKASMVELLMKNMADPDTLSEGLTPTYLAVIAVHNSERLLQLLLGRNAKTLDTSVPSKNNETPLMAAITVARNPRLVKQLVEAGASLDKTNGDGKSARGLVDLLPEEKRKEMLPAFVSASRRTKIPQVSLFSLPCLFYLIVKDFIILTTVAAVCLSTMSLSIK